MKKLIQRPVFVGLSASITLLWIALAFADAGSITMLPFMQYRYDELRMVEFAACILTLLAGLLTFRLEVYRSLYRLGPRILALTAAFFLWGLTSALASNDRIDALIEVTQWLVGFGVIITLSGIMSKLSELEYKLFLACTLVAGAFSVYFVVQVGMAVTDSGTMLGYFWLPWSNPRIFAEPWVLILPVLALRGGELLQGRSSKRHLALQWSAPLLGLIVSTAVWLSGARAPILSMALGAFVAAITIPKGWTLALRLGALIAAGAIGRFMLETIFPGSDNTLIEVLRGGVSRRYELWALAWTKIIEFPFFGIGPGNYALIKPAGDGPAHPHNFILQIGCEWGLPASILVAYFSLCSLKHSHSRALKYRYSIDVAIFIALTAWLAQGLLAGLSFTPSGRLIALPFLAACLALHRTRGNLQQARSLIAPWPPIALLSLSLVASICFDSVAVNRYVTCWPDVATPKPGTFNVKPRLWRQGRLPLCDLIPKSS